MQHPGNVKMSHNFPPLKMAILRHATQNTNKIKAFLPKHHQRKATNSQKTTRISIVFISKTTSPQKVVRQSATGMFFFLK
jgi:hypothetical protein